MRGRNKSCSQTHANAVRSKNVGRQTDQKTLQWLNTTRILGCKPSFRAEQRMENGHAPQSDVRERRAVGIGSTKRISTTVSIGYLIDVSIALPHIKGPVFKPCQNGCPSVLSYRVFGSRSCSDPEMDVIAYKPLD